jgi:flavin-dependent dehydrogenase
VRLGAETTLRVANARTSVRTHLWRTRWLAIGDAAWFLDPLSGNGIERAIDDGVLAAQAISDAIGGDPEALRVDALRRLKAFREAIAVQQRVYAVERRWVGSEFWLRRGNV